MYEQPEGFGIRINDIVGALHTRSKKRGQVISVEYDTGIVRVFWPKGSTLSEWQRITDLVVFHKFKN